MARGGNNPFTWALIAISVIGLVLLTLPTAALLVRAFEARDVLDQAQSRQTLRDALALSLTTSLISLIFVVLVGTPIAYVLARGRFPGVRVLDALVDLPIILPPAVAGIALLSAFGRRGLLGESFDRLGINIAFSTTAVVMAQTFVSAPFFIRTARAGFSRIDRSLEDAGAVLGAGPARVFWRITLPLSRASLVAGAVLAWARALGEFGATIMFAGNREGVTQTMPLAIYERFGAGDLQTAVVLSAILLASSIAFLVAVRQLGDTGTTR
ncbi:MAG: ABC transporter permease [Chloroflexota bacterium]|nr:molybdate ABC transporter permease subunit [Chloroflexia bacterium]MDQ3443884.1 ABC transporter permease [Chloroflexota bacterium]